MRTQQGTAQVVRETMRERGAKATRALREVFNLPTNPSDATILGTALAEIAAEEGRHNAQFASAVRKRYIELAAMRGSVRPQKQALPPLVVIRHDLGMREIDPFAPPDPAFLTQVYGSHQLDRALQEYTVDILKRTADVVQAAHPGTKPTSRAKKQAVIDYIVKYSS